MLWLKEIRKEKNLTQLEVAKKSGITRTKYYNIEIGHLNAQLKKQK